MSHSSQASLTRTSEPGIKSLELKAGLERLRKKLETKEYRHGLVEDASARVLPKEHDTFERKLTPIFLDELSLDDVPRRRNRTPLSTRTHSTGTGEQVGLNVTNSEDGNLVYRGHQRLNSTPRVVSADKSSNNTPRRTASSPDAKIWTQDHQNFDRSDSKVVESWTEDQQDSLTKSYSSGSSSSRSPSFTKLMNDSEIALRQSNGTNPKILQLRSRVGMAPRKSNSELVPEVRRRLRSASWGNAQDSDHSNHSKLQLLDKNLVSKDMEKLQQRKSTSSLRKKADRLTKSDDLLETGESWKKSPVKNVRKSTPQSPSSDNERLLFESDIEKDTSLVDEKTTVDMTIEQTQHEQVAADETEGTETEEDCSKPKEEEKTENTSQHLDEHNNEYCKDSYENDTSQATSPNTLSIIPTVDFELKNPSREDFIASELIGEGAYSKILRATHKPTAKEYAVKVVSKQMARKLGQEGRLRNEQLCLQMVMGHPFIVRLASLFEDEGFLYFVIEFCPYGDMNNLIKQARRKNKVLSKDTIRFYAAELVSALEKVHREGIIHRDVKPQNILIGDRGHLKLTDFGIAARVQSSSSEYEEDTLEHELDSSRRRNSFVGTFTYMAPELIREEGACFASDLWALGVILYQMFTGEVPFKGSSDYLLFQNILKGHVEFPKSFPSASGKDLIEKLLVTDVDLRLGAKGYEELKNHPFFRGIKFEFLDRVDATKVLDIGSPSAQRSALKTVGKTIGSIFSVVGNVANLASLAEIWDSSKFGSAYEKELDDSNDMMSPLEVYVSHEKWRQPSRKVYNLAVEWTGNLVLRHPVEVAKDLLWRERNILEDADRDWALVPSDEYKEFLVAAAQLQSVNPGNLTDPERIAFWTTMYHVMFLHIQKFLTPVTRALRNERFFRDAFYRIYTLDYCLDDIEYGMLGAGQRARKPYFLPDDPREAIRVQEIEPTSFEMLHKIRVSRGFCEPFYQ
eukprot:jgi/Galph1/2677/GphlegSOOS_G1343.1